jgi:thiamine pyrophosphate-dependent acetolactate synthase large subunit-like protein
MIATNSKKVADVLVDTLVAAGVKNIYGLAGDSLNGITDSIRTRDNIKWIPVRHEETAALDGRGTEIIDLAKTNLFRNL